MCRQKSFRLLFVTTAFLLLFPFIAGSNVPLPDNSDRLRPDILTIDIPSSPDHKEMPPVHFMHDRHTQAVEGQCVKCHETREGVPVFKFKRTQEMEGQSYMDLYHDNCIACHQEMKKTAEKTGPMEGECRACHNADFNLGSSWKEIAFDRSLHFRHESAKAIPSKVPSETKNCSACHHSYNEKTKDIFFEKGQEEACISCHKETAVKGIRSGRNAAHDSCVVCHLQLTEKKVETGPVECNGCHEAANQEKIKRVDNVPRLDRNQPDAVLLTGWTSLGTDPTENQSLVAQHMDPVAFDHKSHELKSQSCKVCHHETLKKCDACHTPTGDEKGGYKRLDQAMHTANASQSCLGCHNEKKKAKECAGCHFQMGEKAFEDNACGACHRVDAKSQPLDLLGDETLSAGLAQASLDLRAGEYTRVPPDKIPETVTIKILADEYKPSEFPHGLMVRTIFEQAGQNTMAKAFHGTELNLCTGCHHNSPASLTPPRCASCHGKTPDLSTGKPGLKGAYHGQCITCHQKMEVKSVLPTDCIKCHEKK